MKMMTMSKFMMPKLILALMAIVAIAPACTFAAAIDDMKMEMKMEDSTVSPIADMAIIDTEMKTSTERPPVMKEAEKPKQEEKPTSQRHTVADFIIHPLIAFKPRNPEEDGLVNAGKQATTDTTSTTTPSPWQIFGFNQGLGLGSQVSNSVSNLAGQVTGWLNDRIQFPGLVETPVRESTTTTTTTTTPRPDVVVRVQHKASTRRPLIAINNRNRPNRPQFESEENNDDEDDSEENDNNFDNEDENDNEDESPDDNESSNENENSNEVEESNNSDEDEEDDDSKDDNKDQDNEDDEENTSQRPNNRRRPIRNKNRNGNSNGQRRRVRPQQTAPNTRRRAPNKRKQTAPQRRRPAPASNDVSDEEDIQDDDNDTNQYHDDFYYDTHSKRSQSSPNFIQRGQQQLINQIRQLTRGQTPAEVGNTIRKAQRGSQNNNKRRQQATLFVNRNGQTIYVAPELSQMTAPQFQQVYAQPIVHTPAAASTGYPQPPLTVPLKRKGQPTQYITIPWAQLGISPPNNIVSITEGIQGQPLILNIPQSAINTMQKQAAGRPKKKRPQLITADAVPLLAEASLMDIFKPPVIPPSRTSGSKKNGIHLSTGNVTPVLVAAKPSSTKTSSVLLQQHIRPATVIEKAPEVDAIKDSNDSEMKPVDDSKIDAHRATGENEYILVGQDDEPGLTRQVKPVFGDARYVRLSSNSEYYDVLPRRRFSVRRGGRELTQPDDQVKEKTEEIIPVQIVNEPAVETLKPEIRAKIETIEADPKPTVSEMVKILVDPKPAELPSTPVDTVLGDPKPIKLPIVIPEEQSTPIVAMTT